MCCKLTDTNYYSSCGAVVKTHPDAFGPIRCWSFCDCRIYSSSGIVHDELQSVVFVHPVRVSSSPHPAEALSLSNTLFQKK